MAAMPSPSAYTDPSQERAMFFQTLFGHSLPDGLYAHVWRPSPWNVDWVRDMVSAEASAVRFKRHDVYTSVGLAGRKGAPGKRMEMADAAGLFGFVADIDFLDHAHKRQAPGTAPANEDEALAFLDEITPRATVIIASGHGVQAWWLFPEPWRFRDEAERDQAATISRKWQQSIHAQAAKRGWKLDNVGDLARVMRVPGTLNAKNTEDIVPVRLVRCSPEYRYTLDELKQHIVPWADDGHSHAGTSNSSESVTEKQRFKRSHPCPICDGYEEMEPGKQQRCWGFMGSDEITAYCTREERAGNLQPIPTAIGNAYPHVIYGPCDCGLTHATRPLGDGPVEGKALWNARYYANLYADRLRYVTLFGRWYEWNGGWWEPDTLQAAKRLGYEAVSALYDKAAREAHRTRKKELAELAVKLDTADKIAAMVGGASTFKPIAADWKDFDTDDWRVVAANGVIDLRTGECWPHNPDALNSKHLGPDLKSIHYDPNATCPNWLAFLSKIFPGEHGPEMIAYVQRAAGYSLTGSIEEQCLFILDGDGENGKTTFTQAIRDVLGTYQDELHTETLLSSKNDRIPTDLAKLVGARGAFATENDEHRYLAEGLIKQVTGEEPLAARFMRQDFFTYDPKFKLWLHTNHKPKVRGKDRGIWRRLRVIPFQYTFTEDEKIKGFYGKVLKPELPGILAWMVRGCLEWQRIGLSDPEPVKAAWTSYREQNDTLKHFVEEFVFGGDDKDFLTSADLWAAYSDWCRRNHELPQSQTALSLMVKEEYRVEPVKQKRGRGFPGLRVQTVSVW